MVSQSGVLPPSCSDSIPTSYIKLAQSCEPSFEALLEGGG